MRVVTFKYTGNGSSRRVHLGFTPKVVFSGGDTAQMAAWHAHNMWCARSNVMAGSDSVSQGCRIVKDGFVVGNHAQWNSAGVEYHGFALIETSNSGFDVTSYMGNATNDTVLDMPQQKQIVALLNKRDSSLSGVMATAVSVAGAMSSGVSGKWVTDLGIGQYTITAENEVNQLDGPGGLGEEVTSLVFYESPTVKAVTWTGDGTLNRVLATANFPIKAVLAYRTVIGGGSARMITDTMAGKAKPTTAAAFQPNDAVLSGGTLSSGTNNAALNVAGVVYGAILIGDSWLPLRTPDVIKTRSKQAIALSGTSSYIDCGTADGALMINGESSVEWCGAVYPTSVQNTDCPLIFRGNGGFGAANGYSWGMGGFRSADGGFAWAGPALLVVTAERFDNAPDIRKQWRTGIVLPYGQTFHVMTTHDGIGGWKLYLNGRLVKQRKIDLTKLTGGVFPLPNIQSVSGHRTVIGGRYSVASFTAPQAMKFLSSRVYDRALTADEVAIRHARALLGSTSLTDVTSGMAEEWDAQNARGLALPATVSSANNGTISGGSVVTL